MDVASLRVGDQVRNLPTGLVYVVEIAKWDRKYNTDMVMVGLDHNGNHYDARLWADVENMNDRKRNPLWEKVEANPLEVL